MFVCLEHRKMHIPGQEAAKLNVDKTIKKCYLHCQTNSDESGY